MDTSSDRIQMTGSSVQSEKSLKNKGNIPVIIVMTCLAEGADQLCAETALEVLTEDHEVRERTEGNASVDSEPLRFFLSIWHPRKVVRWWHARKLENPAYIAYVGSWTSDDLTKPDPLFKENDAENTFGKMRVINNDRKRTKCFHR